MNTQHKNVATQQPDQIMLVITPYPGAKEQCVPKVVFEKIKTQIMSRIPLMVPDTDYTAIDLCGKDFWAKEIALEAPRCAGKYIALMVAMGTLPLKANGIDSSSKANWYQLA